MMRSPAVVVPLAPGPVRSLSRREPLRPGRLPTLSWPLAFAAVLCACRAGAGPAGPPASATTPAEMVFARARLVDLTYPFDDQTIYWPTETSGFVLTRIHHGRAPAGFFYSANRLAAPEHGGTHLDAPIHFAEGMATSEQIPLRRLLGPAAVIDMSAAAAANPDARLTADDIAAFERAHGRIAAGTIVLVRSGWGQRWPDRKSYLGDDTPGDATNLHFPGLSQQAAEVLVARQVAAVGIDTASIDHGPSRDFIAHQVFMKADIPAFENVASLDKLPPRGAYVIALPMKIAGGSGGPLRIIAIVP